MANSNWRHSARSRCLGSDVPAGLTFGYPVIADGRGGWSVKEGFELDDFARGKIAITTEELVAERDEVRQLGLI